MTRHHRWPKQATVISPNKSERECENGCGIIMASFHQYPDGNPFGIHWKEFYRGLDRVDVDGHRPKCEPVLEGVQ